VASHAAVDLDKMLTGRGEELHGGLSTWNPALTAVAVVPDGFSLDDRRCLCFTVWTEWQTDGARC
jgi:hypothetical protein